MRDEWQDIETAPKDGTKIDLWSGERLTDCYWGKPDYSGKGHRAWVQDSYESNYGWSTQEVATPTHWMPLPKPPVQP